MRQTRADTALAVAFALLLHSLVVLLMLLGLRWKFDDAAAGQPVNAQLIDANALSQATRVALAAAFHLALPAEHAARLSSRPATQEANAASDAQEQAQEHLQPDAVSTETAEPERDEQHPLEHAEIQSEAEADLTERKPEQMSQEQARNIADDAAQADASASAPPGNNGTNPNLLEAYRAALQEAIQRNWDKPAFIPSGQRCNINIRQLPGGEVVEVQVDPTCPYDELGRRSIEAAVLKASPLPYSGFEPVLQLELTFEFEARD